MTLRRHISKQTCSLAGGLLLTATLTAPAVAQESSLFRAGQAATRQPLSMADVSYTYQPPIPPNEVKLHDHITIVVDEKSLYQAKAILDREKRGAISAILEDWPMLKNFSLKPSPQSDGDPALRASFDSTLEADANHRTNERISFRISAEVVEIRPNGSLVLEGHRQIQNNEEVWEQSITGIIQPDKVDAGRIAKAEDIVELRVYKRERGEVRDGYRRGWLLRAIDRIQSF